MSTNILDTIDARELGKELQAARKSRGMTQEEAARVIDVTRTTVTAIEKGERRVKANELIRLAQAYGRQISDFVRPRPSLELMSIRLRGPAWLSEGDQQQLEQSVETLREYARDYLELEQITDTSLTRKYPPEYPTAGNSVQQVAESIAIQERNRLGLGDGPVPMLRDILEQDVGMRIFYLLLQPSSVSAVYFYAEPLGACIGVNAQHPEERRRWSLAHDYGHFLVARHKSRVSFLSVYQRVPEEERLVDAFAMCFLMPTSSVIRRVNDIKQATGKFTPADLMVQAHYYGVSVEAFTRRLEGMKLLATGVWEHLKERGLKVHEARQQLELERIPSRDNPLPVRYQLLAVDAFSRDRITEGQLARFLHVDRLEARRIAETLREQLPYVANAKGESDDAMQSSIVQEMHD
ncbi:MAG: XRE family transcriptional regulator [Chloroflexi bacterium]|nr:XRE family transcriptional regulator [Chloroflexota bacterium]